MTCRELLIPPLAEQHRIVAKVDELMALCDGIEVSLATGDDTRCGVLEALVGEVLRPIAHDKTAAFHVSPYAACKDACGMSLL